VVFDRGHSPFAEQRLKRIPPETGMLTQERFFFLCCSKRSFFWKSPIAFHSPLGGISFYPTGATAPFRLLKGKRKLGCSCSSCTIFYGLSGFSLSITSHSVFFPSDKSRVENNVSPFVVVTLRSRLLPLSSESVVGFLVNILLSSTS